METSLGVDRREDITLPAAVAISGAAISPAMGKKTRRGVGALLTLTNLRLGVWLPNPRWVQRASEAGITFKERPRASYLLKEIVGSFRRDDPFLYVTDGGHWENLGLVELLRRGCTEIYCFDASGDSVDTFFTLGEAVAIARTELGVEIRVNPEDLREVTQVRTQKGLFARSRRSSSRDSSSATMLPVPGPSPTQSASVKGAGVSFKTEEISQEQDESEVKGRSDVFSFDDHTVAMFKYRDGTPGQIVFSKTAITMQAPWDVKAFAEKDPRFPTNSTADQLYTDERFEAYRALGWFTADHAVNSMRVGP
jgi:hypothetical protein